MFPLFPSTSIIFTPFFLCRCSLLYLASPKTKFLIVISRSYTSNTIKKILRYHYMPSIRPRCTMQILEWLLIVYFLWSIDIKHIWCCFCCYLSFIHNLEEEMNENATHRTDSNSKSWWILGTTNKLQLEYTCKWVSERKSEVSAMRQMYVYNNKHTLETDTNLMTLLISFLFVFFL